MVKKSIKIGTREVASYGQPFLVAELSGNHDGSLDRAMEIIRNVAAAKFDAIKLQTYTADTMTLDVKTGHFFISDPKNLWSGTSLYQLYQRAATPWEWHKPLFEYAKSLGLMAFSTPFDESAVDFLETLDVPCYKIASFEITHLALIRKAAATGKPLILSTGMASLEEIERAINAAREVGNNDLMILKCTSAYPTREEDLNLLTMIDMQNKFGIPVGFSDHTPGNTAAMTSVALGACMIEKHVTLDMNDGAVDSKFSLGQKDCSLFVDEIRTVRRALGSVFYGITEAEKPSLIYRRAVHVARTIKSGDVIRSEDLKIVRPAVGLAPDCYDSVIGKKATRDLSPGVVLSWNDIEREGSI